MLPILEGRSPDQQRASWVVEIDVLEYAEMTIFVIDLELREDGRQPVICVRRRDRTA